MSFAKVYSAQSTLLSAHLIDIEVDLSKGLHAFSIVGLPDKAVEESRDRLSAAIKNSGFTSPKSKNQKVVISLAPADIKKEGPLFDLPMALCYLLAAGDITFNPDQKLFLGELSLDGELRPVRGVLPLVREAKRVGFQEVFLPAANAEEAALIHDIDVFAAKTLREVIDHVNPKSTFSCTKQPPTDVATVETTHEVGLEDIRGQESGKRGLQIAAAGGHNLAFFGPPGTGKTMLARALATILPPLSFEEILEVTSIHSVAGLLRGTLITKPPFRSPHHTSSYVSLVGGGTFPRPGEVTLAHRGVLFLDEFPEFDRRVIEALREPIEDRVVNVSRAKGSASFPADFILVIALNPPAEKEGGIDAREQARFERKLSGPIIDRIDMWIEVPHVAHHKLSEHKRTWSDETETAKKRVREARARQRERFASREAVRTNASMSVRDLNEMVPLDPALLDVLNASAARFDLSPRSYHRMIKLSRTIADLEESETVKKEHLLEALQYRPKKFV